MKSAPLKCISSIWVVTTTGVIIIYALVDHNITDCTASNTFLNLDTFDLKSGRTTR